MTPTPEFSRRVPLDRLGTDAHTISATAGERAALAARFGWIAVDRLDATIALTPRAGGIDAHGTLDAAIVQPCVATGEPVPETITEPIAIRFTDDAMLEAGESEVELSGDDLDTIAHDGNAIDLGEAAAQTLALSATRFPRSAGAAAALKAAGVVSEDEVEGPLAALLKKALKP